MISRIFYVSHSLHPCGHSSDFGILAKAVRTNENANLTGCLLRGGRRFAQSLEGEKGPLEAIFKKIRLDPLHRDLQYWLTHDHSNRLFADWHMIMKNVDEAIIERLGARQDAPEAKHLKMRTLLQERLDKGA